MEEANRLLERQQELRRKSQMFAEKRKSLEGEITPSSAGDDTQVMLRKMQEATPCRQLDLPLNLPGVGAAAGGSTGIDAGVEAGATSTPPPVRYSMAEWRSRQLAQKAAADTRAAATKHRAAGRRPSQERPQPGWR
eukprot:g4160.t1